MSLKSVFTRLTGGNKQAATFLMFVLLSAVIWTINALSQEHITSFEIPIRYMQVGDQAADQNLPTKLNLTVKGKGFYLMRLSADLKKFSIVPRSMSAPGNDTVITSVDAIAPVLDHFKGKLEVTGCFPEQILISGRLLYSRKVAVKAKSRLAFRSTYVQSGPAVIYPDSVMLFSATPMSDTLRAIYTELFEVNKIESDVFMRVKPKLPGAGYHLAAASFWYYLPVEKATEINIDVPIRNSRQAMNEQYLPSFVKLTCRVPLSKFKTTRPDLFLVTPGDTSVNGDKILVYVAHAPYWASAVSISPTLVNRVLKSGY